jgi:hypothetical protein
VSGTEDENGNVGDGPLDCLADDPWTGNTNDHDAANEKFSPAKRGALFYERLWSSLSPLELEILLASKQGWGAETYAEIAKRYVKSDEWVGKIFRDAKAKLKEVNTNTEIVTLGWRIRDNTVFGPWLPLSTDNEDRRRDLRLIAGRPYHLTALLGEEHRRDFAARSFVDGYRQYRRHGIFALRRGPSHQYNNLAMGLGIPRKMPLLPYEKPVWGGEPRYAPLTRSEIAARDRYRPVHTVFLTSILRHNRKGAADGDRYYKPGGGYRLDKDDLAKLQRKCIARVWWTYLDEEERERWCCALPKSAEAEQLAASNYDDLFSEPETLEDERRKESADYEAEKEAEEQPKSKVGRAPYQIFANRHYWRSLGGGAMVRYRSMVPWDETRTLPKREHWRENGVLHVPVGGRNKKREWTSQLGCAKSAHGGTLIYDLDKDKACGEWLHERLRGTDRIAPARLKKQRPVEDAPHLRVANEVARAKLLAPRRDAEEAEDEFAKSEEGHDVRPFRYWLDGTEPQRFQFWTVYARTRPPRVILSATKHEHEALSKTRTFRVDNPDPYDAAPAVTYRGCTSRSKRKDGTVTPAVTTCSWRLQVKTEDGLKPLGEFKWWCQDSREEYVRKAYPLPPINHAVLVARDAIEQALADFNPSQERRERRQTRAGEMVQWLKALKAQDGGRWPWETTEDELPLAA